MTTTALAPRNGLTRIGTESAEIIERVLIAGDLAKLTADERVSYYTQVCASLSLNPLTKPFEYLNLNNKLTLYATRTATDQLRGKYGVSLTIVSREQMGDVYIVTARATLPDGRTDESTGVVTIGTLKGEALANGLMKAETKAKRRVTLSICGLGWMDETETATVRDARRVNVDHETGVILDSPPDAPVSRAAIHIVEAQQDDAVAPVEVGPSFAERSAWLRRINDAINGHAQANEVCPKEERDAVQGLLMRIAGGKKEDAKRALQLLAARDSLKDLSAGDAAVLLEVATEPTFETMLRALLADEQGGAN